MTGEPPRSGGIGPSDGEPRGGQRDQAPASDGPGASGSAGTADPRDGPPAAADGPGAPDRETRAADSSEPEVAAEREFEETRATLAADRDLVERQMRRLRRRAYVVVHRPGAKPVRIDMERTELLIGRHPTECDIVLEGSEVSRRHARIERDARGYFALVDCDSRNGVYVDGRRVTRMNLVDGDVFEIGPHRIEFHTEDPT